MKRIFVLFLMMVLSSSGFLFAGSASTPKDTLAAANDSLGIEQKDKTVAFNNTTAVQTSNVKLNKNNNAEEGKKEDSIFTTNFFYFAGAAVVAVIAYFAWHNKEPETKANPTFGVPLSPK
jgi:hypothetical protein